MDISQSDPFLICHEYTFIYVCACISLQIYIYIIHIKDCAISFGPSTNMGRIHGSDIRLVHIRIWTIVLYTHQIHGWDSVDSQSIGLGCTVIWLISYPLTGVLSNIKFPIYRVLYVYFLQVSLRKDSLDIKEEDYYISLYNESQAQFNT